MTANIAQTTVNDDIKNSPIAAHTNGTKSTLKNRKKKFSKVRINKETVLVGNTVELVENRVGLVRFKGHTKFARGIWYGIELYHLILKTRHNGTICRKRYFNCPRNKGLFVRREQISSVIKFKDVKKILKELEKEQMSELKALKFPTSVPTSAPTFADIKTEAKTETKVEIFAVENTAEVRNNKKKRSSTKASVVKNEHAKNMKNKTKEVEKKSKNTLNVSFNNFLSAKEEEVLFEKQIHASFARYSRLSMMTESLPDAVFEDILHGDSDSDDSTKSKADVNDRKEISMDNSKE